MNLNTIGLTFIETKIKMPLLELPVRTVLAEVRDKRILVSPGSQMTEEHYKMIPNVTDIIAPNLFHNAGMKKAKSHFPSARSWGVPGGRDQLMNPDCDLFSDDFKMLAIDGMPKVNEVIFYHQPSKSLIVTDLAFNLNDVNGFGAWLILSTFGTYKKFGISRFFLLAVKDKAAFKRSLEKIFEWDFQQIIMSHGGVVTTDAQSILHDAFARRNLI